MTLPPIIDAHHHLWDLRRHRYPWLQNEVRPTHFGDYAAIRRDYLVSDYLADIDGQNMRKSVHVEAGFDPADPVAETRWLQSVADEHGYPHAIVARVDLTREDGAEVLAGHARFANLRGVRMMARRPDQIAAGVTGPSVFVDPTFRRNFALLGAHGLTFDLQAPVPLMTEAAALAADFPATGFVLTHVGLPLDRSEQGMAAWRNGVPQHVLQTVGRADDRSRVDRSEPAADPAARDQRVRCAPLHGRQQFSGRHTVQQLLTLVRRVSRDHWAARVTSFAGDTLQHGGTLLPHLT